MKKLSDRVLKNPINNGWPKKDSEYKPVSISFTENLLEEVEDVTGENERSRFIRQAVREKLHREGDSV